MEPPAPAGATGEGAPTNAFDCADDKEGIAASVVTRSDVFKILYMFVTFAQQLIQR